MLTDQQKQALHQAAQTQVTEVCSRLAVKKEEEGKTLEKLRVLLRQSASIDRIAQQALLPIREAAYDQAALLTDAPYFTQCDLLFPGETEPRVFLFAKFSRPDEQIFSWISPVASIRYEALGDVSYRLPDGTSKQAKLVRKDQFMIVKQKILFMSSEAETYARTLVYQDYFSNRKSTFALTDIVAQMEKAQDAVIRAPASGPLLLSGPAGSGKTTLALHRLAYLAQSPETAERFTEASMLVLVQDASSRDYFTELLPSLGIHHVVIETFSQWAMSVLPSLGSVTIRDTHTPQREQQEWYECEKRRALDQILPVFSAKDSSWNYLERLYVPLLSPQALTLWRAQKADKALDRFDLTLLLQAWKTRHGSLLRERKVMVRGTRGVLTERTRQDILRYSTIVLDEIQNYLPHQITLVRSCIDPNTRALLYVGDLAQQTRIGTLRDWKEVGETFLESQRVQLQTVYRNSRQILEYIRDRGYSVSIPERAATNEPVQELPTTSLKETYKVLRDWLGAIPRDERLIGIITPDEALLAELQNQQFSHPNVRYLTFQQAQGVEFSDVAVVYPSDWLKIAPQPEIPAAWQEEQKRVRSDLLYVAFTRAMNRLCVIQVGEG
jgi:DNA helicase IV